MVRVGAVAVHATLTVGLAVAVHATLTVGLAVAGCETASPCDGVTCSGHGVCGVFGDGAHCECDDGYEPAGLECMEISSDGDADLDADGDADGDLDAGVEPDADHEQQPGPITLVATEIGVSSERMCDFDGDGVGDNAIADLGSPNSELFVFSIDSILQGFIERNGRYVAHLPWVDDLSGPDDPEAVFMTFEAWDTDDPVDPSDDFGGDETYYVHSVYLDGCGEPRFFFPSARIDAGRLSADAGVLPMPLVVAQPIPGQAARVDGTIEPGGVRASLRACAYARIGDLGGMEAPGAPGELTLLEVFLAGGAPSGMPGIPGLVPDVDVDHDGLERFVLDGDSSIQTCIDGDGTPIEGRECWLRPEMTDGFALAFGFEAVSASFAGRYAGWEAWAVGTCEGGPPEQSLFDPR